MAEVLPQVKKFLADEPLRLYIGGKFVPAVAGGTFETRDPGTGQVLARVAAGEAADIDAAVGAAQQAFRQSGWPDLPANDRAVILHRLADKVDEQADVLAQLESLDVGKPLGQAAGFDVPSLSQSLRYFADLMVQTRLREPIALRGLEAYTYRSAYGVCGFIIPWNFPLLLLGWNIAPALAAGNTVVVKPAEDTPLSTLYFCRLAEMAGVPAGVMNVVPGLGSTAGAALAAHSGLARIAFTGSPEVGRMVAVAAAKNLIPCKLELGGKGAAIIFDDVDIAQTAEKLTQAVTLNCGQVCCTATRWIIHQRIYSQFVDAVKNRMLAVRLGYGLDPATDMGPVVSEKQRSRVLGYLEKGQAQGATVVLQGGTDSSLPGYFVKPALLAGNPDNICAREEIFGPVAYLMKFSTQEQAIELVHRSRYGLANSVWSADVPRARKVAESLVAGNSWINAHNIFAYGLPYAGANLSGFGGGVNSPETLRDYLRPQSIVRPYG